MTKTRSTHDQLNKAGKNLKKTTNDKILLLLSQSNYLNRFLFFSLVNLSNLLHYEDTFISHFVNLSNLRGKEKCI